MSPLRQSATTLRSSVTARRAGQLAVDACLLALAYYLAYYLRFDDGIPRRYDRLLDDTIFLTVVMKLVIFAAFGLYSKLWRFVDQKDFEAILRAVVVSTVGLIVVLFLFSIGRHDPPRSVVALDFLLALVFVSGARFAVRALVERPQRGPFLERAAHEVLIVGAGNGGQQVAFELRRNPGLRSAPVGFVDDDPRKQGMRIAGIKVLGGTPDLPRVLDGVQPDEVIIAIPSAPGTLRQQVVTACRERGIPVRTLPTTFELLSGGMNLMRQVREVRVEDVLGREPVRVEIDRVGAFLTGRVVLVTGAGGSIGAELCRQIARVGPKRLVLLENSENALFEVQRELEEERHFARAAAGLAGCKDATPMREVFEEHAPSIVFHAAAYKHVPLMEENPVEAVRNNAVATRIVAAAAGEAGVERFVLVSTDKAVSPATVMGASKALAEWAVEAAQNRWKGTRYASVRFGNVLGSSGSVVRIVDLAANMIRLAGLEPDVDIAIEVVGRRVGEKLHEELFNPGERPQPTHAEKIVCAVQQPLDPDWVESAFARIEGLVYAGDTAALAGAVAELSAERALAASSGAQAASSGTGPASSGTQPA